MAFDVQLHQLRALRAVIELGSLTAASERLGFTQSALSKQIAALESAAGSSLFVRGPRGVEPTAAGRRLGDRAARVLDELDAAERELEGADEPLGGRLVLGGFASAAMCLVPRTIARMHRDHPSVEVVFLQSSTPVQLRRLKAGRIDVAVIAAGDDLPRHDLEGIELEPLPSGPLLIAVGEQHRFARSGRVAAAELAREPWIVGRGIGGEPQFGAWPTLPKPQVFAEVQDWAARLGFVAAGLGITTIPSLVADAVPGGVVTVRIDDPGWRGRTLMLGHRGDLDPAGAAMRASVIDEATRIARTQRFQTFSP
jgi:DNA-binding transcriptional LysR family regulator